MQVAGTYQDAYELYMLSGILFDHESGVRIPVLVIRKRHLSVARINQVTKEPVMFSSFSSVNE
jgi:GDP-D-mannose dehydratase